MGVVERLRADSDAIWRKIKEHPFVVELYSGSLPLEKFKFYAIQDYNYLVAMAKCYSIMAAKADDFKVAQKVLEIAYLDATTELESYKKLLAKLGLTLEEAVKAEVAPTNLSYTSFLISTCALNSVLEGLIATLPCFWSYAEIAQHHEEKLKDNRVGLYVEWAKVYLSNDYLRLVEMLKQLVEELYIEAFSYDKLSKIFKTASRFEYMFWDMAYKMESWTV
ncbi:MAG: thiaminase II [Candidatus Methanomethylicota archaeon]|uniref:Thiaminase II n=1 Tax=Thermoproteota archaeon TaxID=2056631 RepID=A0A497ER29_9CREN|nr:MAG: thiaminase II [Candidatus Verstraetearchaeota archaeon]